MKAALFLAATLSQWVYKDGHEIPPNVEKLVEKERYAIVKPNGIFEEDDNEDTCVIVHRGTSDLDDVIHDLESQVDHECEHGHVKAFVDSLGEFRESQHNDMKKLSKEGTCKRYIMTGHSLGGATVSAWGEDPRITYKVTFGEPRACCGNGKSNHLHWRVINGFFDDHHDPVPSFPRRDNVRHCTSNVVQVGVDKKATFVSGADVPPDGKFADKKWHAIGDYIDSIKGLSDI